MSRFKAAVLLCCLTATLVVGCNTTRGVGQDTQALGRSIERAAK
ncbi:MAG: entericidin A/B family lipoprotein [Candidatus Methylomirabilales bacterium]